MTEQQIPPTEYYEADFFKRTWLKLVLAIKGTGNKKFDAALGAIGGFVILIAFLEYKVFESVLGITQDVILSISVLSVTAIAGIYADVFMKHHNDKATDDQILIANTIFYVSLALSSYSGFGLWAQTTGKDVVDFGFTKITLPDFGASVFVAVTIVTIIDVLLFRAYYSLDVDTVHKRNVQRSESRKRQANFRVHDKLLVLEAEVMLKSEQILKIEQRKKQLRESLTAVYGGSVPADVMARAMLQLDLVMQEVTTGEDINKDGVVGLPDETNNTGDQDFTLPEDFTLSQLDGQTELPT